MEEQEEQQEQNSIIENIELKKNLQSQLNKKITSLLVNTLIMLQVKKTQEFE